MYEIKFCHYGSMSVKKYFNKSFIYACDDNGIIYKKISGTIYVVYEPEQSFLDILFNMDFVQSIKEI